jgi:predicted TIM-barrel fold metal-dependent hydrolase
VPTSVPPFIDAHQHFWDLGRNPYPWLQGAPLSFRYGDYAALRRDYLPSDYLADTGNCVPERTVHIEAEWDRNAPVDETHWLEQLARDTGYPSAIVAHAKLDGDDVVDVLVQQAASPLVRGIRHKPAQSASPQTATRNAPGSMDDARWRCGFARLAPHNLSFDLQAPWWDFPAAAALAGDFPSTQIIVNHTGLPADRSPEGLAGWRAAMEQLANCPNVAVKISGLGQRGIAWTAAANVPVIRDAIAIFGPSRCLFASNYPVDSLVADYWMILSTFLTAISDRTDQERQMMLHDNAVRLYRL